MCKKREIKELGEIEDQAPIIINFDKGLIIRVAARNNIIGEPPSGGPWANLKWTSARTSHEVITNNKF